MEKTVNINANQSLDLYINSDIDDSNLKDPNGYIAGGRSDFFNRKITIENSGDYSLTDLELLINDKNFNSFESLKKHLKLGNGNINDVLKIYSFLKDNICHATSKTEGNKNPFYMLNYWGYGLCDDIAIIFKRLLSYYNKTSRWIHLNGHMVMEYLINDEWRVIDADQNIIYLKWDNKSLASFNDIIKDPMIALRTKAYGKYGDYDHIKSCRNTALFEYIEPSANPNLSEDNKKIENLNKHSWILYPGEKIIFYFDECPDEVIGKTNIDGWHKVKETALGKIEMILDAVYRKNQCLSNNITISSKFPIYKIVDDKFRILFEKHDEVRANVDVEIEPDVEKIMVYCQGAKISFPILSKGNNTIGMKCSESNGQVKTTFLLNDKYKNTVLPFIEVNFPSLFDYQTPCFNIKTNESGQKSLIWWQISENEDFDWVIPNFDCVQKFCNPIEISEINQTFLNNNQTYYFRAKVKNNGVWSDWSEVVRFKVNKPYRPENIKYKMIGDEKISIEWLDQNHDDVEYLIFGSNRFDFITSIFNDKQINQMKNGMVEDQISINNLIAKTNDKSCTLKNPLLFYRIIAKKGNFFSVPSDIVNIYSNVDAKFSNKALVLQMRHKMIDIVDTKVNFNYTNLYLAKVEKMPRAKDLRDRYNNLGLQYIQISKLPLAFAAFQKVVETDPHFAEGYANLGLVYYKVKNIKKSFDLLKKALSIEPLNRKAILYFGNVLESIHLNEQAKRLYSIYLQKYPSDMELQERYKN